MTKYLIGALALVLVGGGCVTLSQPESPVVESREEAFPSGAWKFVNTDEYSLPVDTSFELEQKDGYVRIQNFVGSDDPRHEYAADAFFIEIRERELTREQFAVEHGNNAQIQTLGGEQVIYGAERVMGGDTWPGHSYFSADRGVVIYLYYRYPDGAEVAEAVVQQIEWVNGT